MNRKMQINRPHAKQSDARIAYRLILDGTIALLIAALTLWLLMIPVNATERPIQHMTVMTQGLPTDFQDKTATLGLSVLDVEHLEALRSQIVSIGLNDNQYPEHALKTLTTAFPDVEFVLMNDTDEGFGLAGN